MILKLLKKIFPKHKEETNKPQVHETAKRAWIEFRRYQDASQALQKEIENNHFSKILIYDKDKKKEAIEKINKGEERE